MESPNYVEIYAERLRRLTWLRADRSRIAKVQHHYKWHPWDFIMDWGVTVDTRNAGTDTPVVMPFLLWPCQLDLLKFWWDRWRKRESGLTEKSRDMGVSWLAMGFAETLCLFWNKLNIGFGSATQDKVDELGNPDCLFHKGRLFLQYLPVEFTHGWSPKFTKEMLIMFPHTGSTVVGDCGDNIGRGGRTAMYFVDEAAHLEHPKLADAALSANTFSRQDVSSVNGMANSFYEQRMRLLPKNRVFRLHYSMDPRRTPEHWKNLEADTDPVIWAQEYEINYAASVEGVVIPAEWVQAAIDLAQFLNIEVTGSDRAGLDVADQGKDKNAFAHRKAIELRYVESWSGKGSDTFATAQRAFDLCDKFGLRSFQYDADGIGATIRGDSRVLNEQREEKRNKLRNPTPEQFYALAHIDARNYNGSGAVLNPESIVPRTQRAAKDYYLNRKAQEWWSLRGRFFQAFQARRGKPYDRENIISINSATIGPELIKLQAELSQAVYFQTANGKIRIDKAPDAGPGTKKAEQIASPNLADAVVIAFAEESQGMPPMAGILEALGVR